MDSSPPAAPAPRYWTAGRVFLAIAVVLITFVLGAAVGASGSRSSSTPATVVSSTSATPTAVPTPTAAPTPLALSGQGSRVLSVALHAGRYRVSWTTQGHDNFIVIAHGQRDVHLVNEIPPNPAAGETLLTVDDSSTYTLEVKASTLSWTITFTPM